MENRRLHVTQPKHVVANSYGSFGAENENQKGNLCLVCIQTHDKRTRFSPDAYLCHVLGGNLPVFVSHLCVSTCCYLLFCSVLYATCIVLRLYARVACCMGVHLYWLGDCSQAPAGGCTLTTTLIMGETLMFFRSARGVVPSHYTNMFTPP